MLLGEREIWLEKNEINLIIKDIGQVGRKEIYLNNRSPRIINYQSNEVRLNKKIF